MVAFLFGNSNDEVFEGFDLIHKLVNFHLFCYEKRGGLWMVRYSLYQGRSRLIFASEKLCVCLWKIFMP